jgi:replicative DNA helicase
METPKLYDEESERQILGVCVVNPQNIDEIDLLPEDFYIDKHRAIWAAMRAMVNSDITPDYVTLVEYFERQDKLRQIGGESYLTGLVAESTFSAFLPGWVKVVADYAIRRRILDNASRLANIAMELDKPIIDPLAEVMDNLATGIKPRTGAAHWGDDLSRYYDWLEERSKNPGDMWGIPTGFVDYDRLTGGLQAGDLLYIAGEPGIGKTILATQMGVQMAAAGFPGAIYSLEMASRQIIGRIISGMTKVQSRTMKTGRMTVDNWDDVTTAIERANKYPLYLSDDGTLTTVQLRADLARLKIRHGLLWCIVDYDMLLNDGDGRLDEIQFSTLVSKRLKNIAKDLEIAVITVSSVTKDAIGEDGAPSMRGIRGGAQKLHNADIMAFLTKHIPDKKAWENDNPNLRTVTFVKGRELESLGSFNLVKFEKYPAFGNYAKE